MRVLAEATTADVKSVLADQTMMVLAHSAVGRNAKTPSGLGQNGSVSKAIRDEQRWIVGVAAG
jgi:hypothetical protein